MQGRERKGCNSSAVGPLIPPNEFQLELIEKLIKRIKFRDVHLYFVVGFSPSLDESQPGSLLHEKVFLCITSKPRNQDNECPAQKRVSIY